MTLDEYLASPEFQAFQDETLREQAIQAVDAILAELEPVGHSQLHAIPNIIRGAGLSGLKDLAKKQKEKNPHEKNKDVKQKRKSTREKNKDFWTKIDTLISMQSTSDMALSGFLESHLRRLGIIEHADHVQEKKAQKQIKRRNKKTVEAMMERVLGVYFEHFNCHYFYKTKRQGGPV